MVLPVMSFTDPLLPYSGIHATREDLKRNREVARKLLQVRCEHTSCHVTAKTSFRLENGDLIDVCIRHFLELGTALRDEDC